MGITKDGQLIPAHGPVTRKDVVCIIKCQQDGCYREPTHEATANGWAWQPLCQKHADERAKTGWNIRRMP
jgi:hypothetical protein